MEDRQEEWEKRYRPAAATRAKVKVNKADLTYMTEATPEGINHSRSLYDKGQYRYNEEEFYCKVCDVYVQSRNTMDSHLSGKEYKRRVKPIQNFYCDVCHVEVSLAGFPILHFAAMRNSGTTIRFK